MFWKVLGGFLLIKYGISMIQFILFMLRLYVLPKFGLKKNLKKYGEWAVVTGATDGIGKAIAKQLAKRGLNIVMISRNEEKLKQAACEIESHNVKVITIQYDFTQSTNYKKIADALEGIDIGILVNNVGLSYDHPDTYLYYTEQVFEDIMNVNVTSVLQMTRIVLKGMEERGKGLVVHVCSGSAVSPMPLITVYGAAKAFVMYFGKSLGLEYKNSAITSQIVIPFYVATKMSKLRASGFFVPSPDMYAAQMVNALGLSSTMCGFWFHEIMKALQTNLPAALVNPLVYNHLNALRTKWHRRNKQQ